MIQKTITLSQKDLNFIYWGLRDSMQEYERIIDLPKETWEVESSKRELKSLEDLLGRVHKVRIEGVK